MEEIVGTCLPCVIVEVIGKAQAMYRLRCKCGVFRT